MSLRDVKTHNAITTNKTNIKIPSKNVINTLYVIQYKITIHATWWKGLKKEGEGGGAREGGNLQVELCSEPVTPDTTTRFP